MGSWICLIVLVCFAALCHCQGEKKYGLYNVTIMSMGLCPDMGTNEMYYKARMSKISKTKVCFSGWITMPYGYNDDLSEHWEISQKGSTGGWKANFLSFRNKKACSETKRLFPQWFRVLEVANLSDTSCPIPKGNYSFGCLDLSDMQFEVSSVMLYGQYRATSNYFMNGTKVGCTMYIADVHPRINATSPSPQASLVTNHETRQYHRISTRIK